MHEETFGFKEAHMALSWREAIEHVLKEEARALHYSEISELILSNGYYKTEGATPDATVNAQITSSIKHEGEKSPFLKVSRGTFALQSAAPRINQAASPPRYPAAPDAAGTKRSANGND